ncbi:histidine kinase [Gilvimarinus polysaccharolyticus]|uniref:histidine kinase n=1 Tax=Gilvimarinus polysaccharolyticus TaxID=863921 RepID=UPI0006732D6E|nr:histidine kinase [Gilvimarinus polysaccharolyticus]
MRQSSLVISIKLTLAGIVALAAMTMAVSYWISDRSDNDAYAINLAGSLRMQTYRLALLTHTDSVSPEAITQARKSLEQTWNHPLIQSLQQQSSTQNTAWTEARDFWLQHRQQPNAQALTAGLPILEQQVEKLDKLVQGIQSHTEANAQKLRLVQVISLFSILTLAAVVIYWLRIRMELPLLQLGQMSRRISQGDFDYRITSMQTDELGSLAKTFNKMSDSISHMHKEMEQKIQQQTFALKRSNTALQFLYDTAKAIIEQEPNNIDYQPILQRLQGLVEVDDIELCLITEAGDSPYRQVKPESSPPELCMIRNCEHCLAGNPVNEPNAETTVYRYSFPMNRDQNHYGVLVARTEHGQIPEPWQQQLMQSVADQIAMALSLQIQEDDARRLSLAHERTVIARELHDSLAQALSYLKIQVTRLKRALVKDDKKTLEDVSFELHQGLTSAYQQLRELLTTFRLKIDAPGLLGALQGSVKQLSEQTEMNIELDYQLENLPLTPNEEIHLLQIVREAVQNSIHHSRGKNIEIFIKQAEKQVIAQILDDGIGINENPHKLNHYGLTIMQERGKNLNGELTIVGRDTGGTCVTFVFTPVCLSLANVFARE